MRRIPRAVGLYFAALQFIFALCWTSYSFYLPKLAAEVGLSAAAVTFILMLDQAIFTVVDYCAGVAADKVSRLVGRLGHWVAGVATISCMAFLALPFVARLDIGAPALLVVILIWAVTSAAMRAPPLALLGKYAARPTIPFLAGFAMLGLGIASGLAPYLTRILSNQDPRLPFAFASVALLLTGLTLAKIERTLAKDAPPTKEWRGETVDRTVPAPIFMFGLATVILTLGFQLHLFVNSEPLFKKFASDTTALMQVFWVGFSIGMFPASLVTKRWGGLRVMGAAGLVGATAIVVAEISGSLGLIVAAQAVVGAAWGCILVSALAAAAALGAPGHEGKVTGTLFSALALATLARMAINTSGALGDLAVVPLLRWAPLLCWTIAGALLLAMSLASARQVTAPRAA
jgi:Major Facilitator Superfamily